MKGILDTKYGPLNFRILNPTEVEFTGKVSIDGNEHAICSRLTYHGGGWCFLNRDDFLFVHVDQILAIRNRIASEIAKEWSKYATDDVVRKLKVNEALVKHTELEHEVARLKAELAGREAALAKLTRDLLSFLI